MYMEVIHKLNLIGTDVLLNKKIKLQKEDTMMSTNLFINYLSINSTNLMEVFNMNSSLLLNVTLSLLCVYFFMYFNNLNTFIFVYVCDQLPAPHVFNRFVTFILSVFGDDKLDVAAKYFGEDRVAELAESLEIEKDMISDSSKVISDRKDFVKYIASVKNTTFGYNKYILNTHGFSYYVCSSAGLSRYDVAHVLFSSFRSRRKSGRAASFTESKLGTRSFIHVEYKEKDYIFKNNNCIAIIPSESGLTDKLFIMAKNENGENCFFNIKTKEVLSETELVSNSNALFYRFLNRTASQERKSTATFVLVRDYNNYEAELTHILNVGTQGEFNNIVDKYTREPNLSEEQKSLNVIGNIQTVGKNLGKFNKVGIVDGKITLYYEIINKTTGKTELKSFKPFDGQGIARASAVADVATKGLQALGHDVIVLPQSVMGLAVQCRLHTDKGVLYIVGDRTFEEIFRVLKEDYNFIPYGYSDANELPEVIMDRNQVKLLPENKDCDWLFYILSISKLTKGNSSVQGIFDTFMELDFYNLANGKAKAGYENMANYIAGVDMIKDACEEKLDAMRAPAPVSSSDLANRPVTDVLMAIDNETFFELPAVRHSVIKRATNKIFNKYINKLSIPIDTYNGMLQCDWSALLLSEKNSDGKRIVKNVLKYNEILAHLNSDEAVCVKYPKVAGEHHVVKVISPAEYMNRVSDMNLPENIFNAISDIYTNTWEGNVIVPAIELLFVKESGADCDGDKFSMMIDPLMVDTYKQLDELGQSYIIMKDVDDDGVNAPNDYII